MRVPVVFVLMVALAACSGPGSFQSTGLPAAQRRANPASGVVIDPLAGVSAHYVVEMGRNADGMLQVDVRQMQEPSIFASPQPFRSAAVVYPDSSTQHVDANGMFDAADSAYARKHGEHIGDPNVMIRIVSPIAIAFQPTTFGIYVPSKRDERRESSVAAAVQFTLAGNLFPKACKASSPAQDVPPNDVGDFVFTTPQLLGPSFAVDLSSCTLKSAIGRVNDYEWVTGLGKVRYTLRYQAPSATALKAQGVSAVGEYISLPGSTAAAAVERSPRYDVACSSAGC